MVRTALQPPPHAYHIDIQGDLRSWKGRLGQLQLSTRNDPLYGHVTSLRGAVQDQAELFGILNTIYELHLPVLLIRAMSGDIGPGPVNTNRMVTVASENTPIKTRGA